MFSFTLSWKYAFFVGRWHAIPHRFRYSPIFRRVTAIPYFPWANWHTAARVQGIKLIFTWPGALPMSRFRISFSCASVSWRFSPTLRPRFFSPRHFAPSFCYAPDILPTVWGGRLSVSAISLCLACFFKSCIVCCLMVFLVSGETVFKFIFP